METAHLELLGRLAVIQQQILQGGIEDKLASRILTAIEEMLGERKQETLGKNHRQEIQLSSNEEKLFRYIAQQPGHSYSFEELFFQVWGRSLSPGKEKSDKRNLCALALRLNEKLRASALGQLTAVPGKGYRFER